MSLNQVFFVMNKKETRRPLITVLTILPLKDSTVPSSEFQKIQHVMLLTNVRNCCGLGQSPKNLLAPYNKCPQQRSNSAASITTSSNWFDDAGTIFWPT